MFRSTSSSAVGRIESLRINRAPIASFVSAWSFSACSLRIFLFISSCRSGLNASFNDKLSFRAILAARSGCGGSSRYNIGPSFESLSSSSCELPAEPFEAPYGLAFSLFSIVHGKAKPKRVGRELQRFFTLLLADGVDRVRSRLLSTSRRLNCKQPSLVEQVIMQLQQIKLV